MMIEIKNPEDEEMIRTKLQNGEFRSVDELIHIHDSALRNPTQDSRGSSRPHPRSSQGQQTASRRHDSRPHQ